MTRRLAGKHIVLSASMEEFLLSDWAHRWKSVVNCRLALKKYFLYCTEREVEPEKATSDHLMKYYRCLRRMKTVPYGKLPAISTIVNDMCHVRQYYDWLADKQIIPVNIANDIKLQRRPPRPLISKMTRKAALCLHWVIRRILVTRCSNAIMDAGRWRDMAAVVLLMSTGMGAQCLSMLTVDQVSLGRRELIISRHGKDRIIQMPIEYLKILSRYARFYRCKLTRVGKADCFLIDNTGDRLLEHDWCGISFILMHNLRSLHGKNVRITVRRLNDIYLYWLEHDSEITEMNSALRGKLMDKMKDRLRRKILRQGCWEHPWWKI